MKSTDHSCACNNLTSFEYEVHGMTGNGSFLKYAETCMKKFVKSFQVNLFLAAFSSLKLVCHSASLSTFFAMDDGEKCGILHE